MISCCIPVFLCSNLVVPVVPVFLFVPGLMEDFQVLNCLKAMTTTLGEAYVVVGKAVNLHYWSLKTLP
jgi:hypothetical protein